MIEIMMLNSRGRGCFLLVFYKLRSGEKPENAANPIGICQNFSILPRLKSQIKLAVF